MKRTLGLLLCVNYLALADMKISTKLDPLYLKECSSCHMAYQPELLNKEAWSKLMANLNNHFKTDASLDTSEQNAITKYLMQNASMRIKNSDNVIAISQTPWFVREHRKISQKTLSHDNIKSISNCAACHRGATKGDYDEDSIQIPGATWKHH